MCARPGTRERLLAGEPIALENELLAMKQLAQLMRTFEDRCAPLVPPLAAKAAVFTSRRAPTAGTRPRPRKTRRAWRPLTGATLRT